MTSDNEAAAVAKNVLAFQLRPKPVPVLQFVELRLADDCSLEMTLYDAAGDVVAVLSYDLQSKPDGFDLSWLAEAWARWRSSSTIAS
jgi:hypothetical protein